MFFKLVIWNLIMELIKNGIERVKIKEVFGENLMYF